MPVELIILFFFVAFLYASAGFGGGSTYLALLSHFSVGMAGIKLTALLCNIVVVSGGSWLYIRNKILSLREALPFILLSVPMAYIGGLITLDKRLFFSLLGITLIVAGISLAITTLPRFQRLATEANEPPHAAISTGIGGSIGLLSGLLGIGGGIFLSPILHFMRAYDAKRIAGLASFFIFVNSIAGLIAQISKLHSPQPFYDAMPLAVAVFLGGQLGSRSALFILNTTAIKRVTALLIFAIGIELTYTYLILWK